VDEDGFGWSIADLMTLLLIFFILFYSNAITQLARSPDINTDEGLKAGKPNAGKILAVNQIEMRKKDIVRKDPLLARVIEKAQGLKQKHNEDYAVRYDEHRVVFVLGEKVLFERGEAELLPEAKEPLLGIAQIIGHGTGFQIRISGHTDSLPIRTEQFPTNWELSASRAANAAKFLIDNGVASHRISIQGFAEKRPLFKNNTAQKRQQNRRVEIELVREVRSWEEQLQEAFFEPRMNTDKHG
jgi:chemotaxis protein MotB